jgi:Fe-S cluster assembly scaffold protein SufB
MAIHSFLKADRGDPDWQFSPEDYFGKEFKIIDASTVELDEGVTDRVVLRQNPTERELLAKHLKIIVQKDSMLELTILNDVDANLQQVFLYDIHLKPGAGLVLGLFAKNGKFNKHILQVFQEEGSRFTAFGIASNESAGDTEIVTKIVHQGEGSTSSQLFLGMAGENSQTVYQGIVIAEAAADSSDISIESSNLIIGSQGRCYAKPEMYINAEDVTSDHGCETQTISLEKISYLQSRGIPAETAREMIISGFRAQVISIVSEDNIREEIKEMYAD